jgi:Glycosyl transferase family 90
VPKRMPPQKHRTYSSRPLLCVVHIPKTAGSAIRETLASTLGDDKVYWIGHRRPHEEWDKAKGTEFDSYLVVGGHRPAEEFDKIARPKVFVAVLRDPVGRAVSLFNYITQGPDRRHPMRAELQGLSVIDALTKSANFRREVANFQCVLIGGAPTFSAALQSLCRREWEIDTHENVQALFDRLCRRFDFPVAPLIKDNVGKAGYAAQHLSPDVAAALTEINRDDELLVSLFKDASKIGLPIVPRRGVDAARPPAVDEPSSAPSGDPDLSIVDGCISAAYRGLLQREPDRSGLVQYRNAFNGTSLGAGIERVSRLLVGSKEFEARYRDKIVPRPKIATLPSLGRITLDEPQKRALAHRIDEVIVARFQSAAGARPTLYLSNDKAPTNYRVARSVEYVDSIVSDYLLHQNYYYRHRELLDHGSDELMCVFQLDDRPTDLVNTVAYTSSGTMMTLIPDIRFWQTNGYFQDRQSLEKAWTPWNDRHNRFFWRGATTGEGNVTADSISALPRTRLCIASLNYPDIIDAKFTDVVQAKDDRDEGEIRAYLEHRGLMAPRVPQTEFQRYRFLIDIDGNSSSWGFLLKLAMGSCILKVESNWRQWYYDELRPWHHYVPVRSDLADLDEQIAWCADHDEEAHEIAENGMRFAKGIVFGTEMVRAAGLIAKSSVKAADFDL